VRQGPRAKLRVPPRALFAEVDVPLVPVPCGSRSIRLMGDTHVGRCATMRDVVDDLWWRDEDAEYIRHRSDRYPGATNIEPDWTLEAPPIRDGSSMILVRRAEPVQSGSSVTHRARVSWSRSSPLAVPAPVSRRGRAVGLTCATMKGKASDDGAAEKAADSRACR
jgi:hypothetical protein